MPHDSAGRRTVSWPSPILPTCQRKAHAGCWCPTLNPAEDRRKGLDRRTLGERRSRAALQRLFPHVQFNEREAADRSAAIEAHRRELGSRLGRNVGLTVAALDYLSNISRDVVAPAIVERAVLEVLEHRSVTDPLTGLFNRYHLEATLKQEVARCLRYGARLSLLLLDVDQLKVVNDRWGHQAGDRLLRHVAAAIRASLRQSDIATRYGGDEFAVILPDTDARAGRLVAERICTTVAVSLGEGIVPGVSLNSTVSGGLAELPPAAPSPSDVQLIVAADRALYLAKGGGGNCVVEEVLPWRG